MRKPGENLESLLYRHGAIADFSKQIERSEKPPYEDFKQFMTGEIDPPIDPEVTRELIQQKIETGEMPKDGFDIIICSPALRAQQTSEVFRDVVQADVDIHPTKYLREVKFPMKAITPKVYKEAQDLKEIRKKFIEAFINGDKIDEDIVDLYKRAQRVLRYLRGVKNLTEKKPLYISHGFFPRFIEMAINHQHEDLSDEEIRAVVTKELPQIERPGILSGMILESKKVDDKEITQITGRT